jgi:hypothetical protein
LIPLPRSGTASKPLIHPQANRIVNAKDEARQQPASNFQIAKAYLAAADPNFVKRNWAQVMADRLKLKTGTNRTRSERAVMDHAFDSIREMALLLPDLRSSNGFFVVFIFLIFCRKIRHNSNFEKCNNHRFRGFRKYYFKNKVCS